MGRKVGSVVQYGVLCVREACVKYRPYRLHFTYYTVYIEYKKYMVYLCRFGGIE